MSVYEFKKTTRLANNFPFKTLGIHVGELFFVCYLTRQRCTLYYLDIHGYGDQCEGHYIKSQSKITWAEAEEIAMKHITKYLEKQHDIYLRRVAALDNTISQIKSL